MPHADPQLAAHKARVQAVREEARAMLAGNANGIQVAARIAERFEAFLVERYQAACAALPPKRQRLLAAGAAVTFIGGSGRGELCPYSDIDLLFLHRPQVAEPFAEVVAQVIRQGWDAGLKIGHSVRTVEETLRIAREEPQVATSLVELRPLAGDAALVERMRNLFRDRIVRRRQRNFVNDCLGARAKRTGSAWRVAQHDRAGCQTQPRRLARCASAALGLVLPASTRSITTCCGCAGRSAAKMPGICLKRMSFCCGFAVNCTCRPGGEHDLLTREDQQRIAETRGIAPQPGRKPVERFMQTYLGHATTIAEITDRFVTRHRPWSLARRMGERLLTRRASRVFHLGPHTIRVSPRAGESVLRSPERVLDLFRHVAKSGVEPTPETSELIRRHVPGLPAEVSVAAAEKFHAILSQDKHLGTALRAMYRTGVLEWLIPDLRHARCLIQFNQYHSFTVDEHCFQAVEAVSRFAADAGTLGEARRAVRRPVVLNLATLLHDIGKGFDRDHSEVGREIACRVAGRLRLPEEDRDRLAFLVHKHLNMAHLAFRRDTTDPNLAVRFSHEVGSPETLRMMYLLSAADLSAVGPGVWTAWKAELLTDLYGQAMHILSGNKPRLDAAGLAGLKDAAAQAFLHSVGQAHRLELAGWVTEHLDAFSPQYLAITPVSRVVCRLAGAAGAPTGGGADRRHVRSRNRGHRVPHHRRCPRRRRLLSQNGRRAGRQAAGDSDRPD